MSLLEAANESRRHYVETLTPKGHWQHGATGAAICSPPDLPLIVEDEAARRHNAETYGYRFVDARHLPLCKRCQRKAAKS